MALQLLPSCFAFPMKPGGVCSMRSPQNSLSLPSFTFAANLHSDPFHQGALLSRGISIAPRRMSVVCESGSRKKPDWGAKRARQEKKRRVYIKARKSEIKTRTEKVFDELYKKMHNLRNFYLFRT